MKNTAKQSATKQTAEETYRTAATDIHALLDFIGQEIKAHEKQAQEEGIHWAHAGSMQHWKEILMTALIDVMGAYDETECRKMIEDALDDVKI